MKIKKSRIKEIIREVIEEETALDKARAKALDQKTKEREVRHKKKHADWYGHSSYLDSKKESITGTAKKAAKKAGKKVKSAVNTAGRLAKTAVTPNKSVTDYFKDDENVQAFKKAWKGPKKKSEAMEIIRPKLKEIIRKQMENK